MQIQKEKLWKYWKKRNQYGSLFSKNWNKNLEKNKLKKKDIILKVNINIFDLDR